MYVYLSLYTTVEVGSVLFVKLPKALCHGKAFEDRLERAVSGRTSHNSKPDFTIGAVQMENPHLMELDAIEGIFNAEITFPSA